MRAIRDRGQPGRTKVKAEGGRRRRACTRPLPVTPPGHIQYGWPGRHGLPNRGSTYWASACACTPPSRGLTITCHCGKMFSSMHPAVPWGRRHASGYYLQQPLCGGRSRPWEGHGRTCGTMAYSHVPTQDLIYHCAHSHQRLRKSAGDISALIINSGIFQLSTL